jgi:hypothetical protein
LRDARRPVIEKPAPEIANLITAQQLLNSETQYAYIDAEKALSYAHPLPSSALYGTLSRESDQS